MSEKYTVEEIDDLRRLCSDMYLFGSYRPKHEPGKSFSSRACREDEKATVVEQQVRTFMLAGIRADDVK